MDAIPFTSGQDTNLLLLIGPAEIEPIHIGASINFPATHFQRVMPARDFLVNGFLRIQGRAGLIDITEFHGFADTQQSGIRFLQTIKHLK